MKLAIFDKDGTLTIPKSGAKFVENPQDQIIKPGALEIYSGFIQNDYQVWVASNQAGIQFGHKSVEEAFDEMIFCYDLFANATKTGFDGMLFCADMKGKDCYQVIPSEKFELYKINSPHWDGQFRKPSPGMLKFAQQECLKKADKPMQDFVMIGDRTEDEQAAINAQARFIHIDALIHKMLNS